MSNQDLIAAAMEAIEAKDWVVYGALIDPNVKWYTPLFDEPVIGRDQMLAMQPVVLGEVFETFRYTDIAFGKRFVFMHFTGIVSGVEFSGTDRLVVENERIVEFHVDGRTLGAMQIFGAAVGKTLAERGLLPA